MMGNVLDVAIRKADGSTAVDWAHVGVRSVPPLPVAPALHPLLPGGRRRGGWRSSGRPRWRCPRRTGPGWCTGT